MLKERIKSFHYAISRIIDLFRTEANARFHLIAAAGVTTAGFYFSIEKWEWVAVIFSIGLVLSAEAFNTALEHLTDLVSPEQNPLAGKTKDVAAGAVLFSAITAAIIGGIVFLPKIIALF